MPPATLSDQQTGRKPIKLGPTQRKAIPPAPEVKLYECGTKDGCPRQNLSIKGMSFAAFRGTPTIHTDGRVTGVDGYGQRQYATDARVKAVLEEMSHKVVRMYGTGRGDIYDDRAQNFRAEDGDQRLSDFLWIHEITESGLQAETAAPETLS